MPLNTRSPQTTDKAGEATGEDLPEQEGTPAEAGTEATAPTASGPDTEPDPASASGTLPHPRRTTEDPAETGSASAPANSSSDSATTEPESASRTAEPESGSDATEPAATSGATDPESGSGDTGPASGSGDADPTTGSGSAKPESATAAPEPLSDSGATEPETQSTATDTDRTSTSPTAKPEAASGPADPEPGSGDADPTTGSGSTKPESTAAAPEPLPDSDATQPESASGATDTAQPEAAPVAEPTSKSATAEPGAAADDPEPEPEHALAAPASGGDSVAEHGPERDAGPVPGGRAISGAAEAASPAGADDRSAAPESDPAPEADAASEARPAPEPDPADGQDAAPRPRLSRLRDWGEAHPRAARVPGIAVTVLAGAFVVAALLLPSKPESLKFAAFTRLPMEALTFAVLLAVLPRRPRLTATWIGGITLGVLTLLNLLDIGFQEYLGRGFDVILDWPLFPDGYSYLEDTLGGTGAVGVLVAVLVIAAALLLVPVLALVRLGGLMARHRATTTRTVLVLSLAWMICTALGLRIDGVPVAAERTVHTVQARSDSIHATLRDEQEFARTAGVDAFGGTPGSELVPDLRGKDMIFTFIESYGRTALEDPEIAPGVEQTLAESNKALTEAGFQAKSGWLTSATYGAGSWLGHSTFLSGLWIDNQSRYRTVTTSDRLTLTKAFQKTGDWDTVGVMPGVQKGWPEQKFHGLDKVYNAFQLGYQGPKFSWSTMPDQYTLEAYQQLEHSKKRDKPLMSEIILTSSHQPWSPIPKMVGWDELGNGSVFDAIEKAGTDPKDVIADSALSKEGYGQSIQYSLTSLTQFLERYGTDDTVLVFLGDHQPISRVSGDHASRDVPCTVVAKDPAVLDKIADWGWSDGLRPAQDAPVWKMSSFRDRFLTAYGSTPHPKS
ncbi:CDP-alcohol phosphatidyltransferase [Streptomyces nodosus]